ncbi:MAG: hypothetical protein RML92_05765, partial [Bacteroidia bacterium]|nr:hypothetical protein [Bacteroidia bacterium]
FAEQRAEMDRRFAEQREYMDKRFEAVEKRFEAVDKRFEDMNRRFQMLFWFMGAGFTLLTLLMSIYEFIR